MNGITAIRKKLGLNQQQVAEWLGISRSLVALYEREERKLPHSAVVQLAALEIALYGIQQTRLTAGHKQQSNPHSFQRHEYAKRSLNRQAKACGFKAAKMRMKLITLKTAHEQMAEWLEAIESLILQLPKDPGNNMKLLWLQAQQQMALKKLQECDPAAQLIMEAKIAVMDAAKEVHERMSGG